jgi:hypothetical protein
VLSAAHPSLVALRKWRGWGVGEGAMRWTHGSMTVSFGRFYLLEEGPFEMEGIERCFEARRHLSSREGHEGIDAIIKIGEREHLNALYLLPALRKHPLRTRERHEADLFVIAYDSGEMTQPQAGLGHTLLLSPSFC